MLWYSSDQNSGFHKIFSYPRVIMGKNDVIAFSQIYLIGSFSYLHDLWS